MEHPKKILEAHAIEPKKSLGQNFLFDENILERIVAAAELNPTDEVLEIGPGLGSLTQLLAQRTQRVVAVELDGRLLAILQSQLAHADNVELIQRDILKVELASLFTAEYKVVANVPYYITGRILRYAYSSLTKPTSVTLTVQKELAERICAQPNEMSLLAVSVQFYGRPRVVTTLPAGAFWPRPTVDSAVIHIESDSTTPWRKVVQNEAEFFKLVRAGFSQKRKQLKNNLRNLGVDKRTLAQIFEETQIDGRRRAETLHLSEWAALYSSLQQIKKA